MINLSTQTLVTLAQFGIEKCIEDFNSCEWSGNGAAGIVGSGDRVEILATHHRIEAGREVYNSLKCPFTTAV